MRPGSYKALAQKDRGFQRSKRSSKRCQQIIKNQKKKKESSKKRLLIFLAAYLKKQIAKSGV